MIGALLRPVGFVLLGVLVGITGVVVANLTGGGLPYALLGMLLAIVAVAVVDIVLDRVRRVRG